jgi:hypothetical protein
MDVRVSHNETIVEIEILELGNTSYSSFMIFPKFTIFKFVFRKKSF